MASNVVRVELSKAQKGANELNTALNTMKTKVKTMRGRVDETCQWWEGDTGTTFRQSFGRACDYFNNTLTKKLQDHADRMLKSVQMQHNQDTNIASQIKRY